MRDPAIVSREINETLARVQPDALALLQQIANDPNQSITNVNEARRLLPRRGERVSEHLSEFLRADANAMSRRRLMNIRDDIARRSLEHKD
ncbi:MAG: hypothetical protein ABSD90_14175 [Methylocystis sp.]|jgi:hypothetical protein